MLIGVEFCSSSSLRIYVFILAQDWYNFAVFEETSTICDGQMSRQMPIHLLCQ